uniref:WGS project CBMI000000000 data, contig CS3069_c002516 n=1 Tax=Fusarium clavum TaxID=2594811 RepID=A0A090MH26_9HYPO|nr:unnamed protein product [Fusarium clavum]
MCQTTNTSWVCATCSVSVLDKRSVKAPCQDYKDEGICTVALPPLNDSDDEKSIRKKISKKMCLARRGLALDR